MNDVIQDRVPMESVRNLGFIKNLDKTITAQQFLIDEILIFIITQSTTFNYETDTPELDWERQLDIGVTVRDLKNILGMASVIQTKSSQFNEVLMNVRVKMPIAKNKTIHYCNLDFGHLYRFGQDDNFLLVLDPTQLSAEKIDKLRFNDLPYILSLHLIIKEYNRLFTKHQKQLIDIEKQVQEHSKELSTLNLETDPIMLAIRKDHATELDKKTSKIQLETQDYANKLNSTILRLNNLMQNMKLIKDSIFTDDIEEFQEYNLNIQKWLRTSDEVFTRIFTALKDYLDQVSELLQKLEQPLDKPLGRPKVYTDTTSSDFFSFDKSPYKKVEEEFGSISEPKLELLESIPLEWCSSYVLFEHKPSRSLKIFSDLVKDRFLGLCITRNERNVLLSEFKFKDTEVYQINTVEGENTMPPILSKISHVINDFLSNNVHSIIYIDGFDFLIEANDFDRVIKFNDNIKESIVLNDSILILSINESLLNTSELPLLLKNTIDISNCDVEFEDIL